MVGKRAPAPRSGGSARNAIWYVLGEELSSKVAHESRDEPLHASQKAELSALLSESLERKDLGVGAVWSPSTAADGRPSSVFCRGVTSLYSAPMEIQSLFDASSRCRSPVAHFIFSLSTAESATVSDAQLIEAGIATLDGAGWGTGSEKHALVAAVHQDTMRWDDIDRGDGNGPQRVLVEGNKHLHVAVASVGPNLRAYDRTQEYMRLHKSLREQEIAFGMEEDWGLYKIADRGLSTQRVMRTDAVDWEARKQERAFERAERLARHFVSDHEPLESVRDRQDRIVHAMREYLERCDARGEKPLQSDMHLIASRMTAQIEGVIDGKLFVRLMERAEQGEVRRTWTDSFGNERERPARWVPTDTLLELDEKRIARSPLDDYSAKTPPSKWLETAHAKALERRAFLTSIGSQEEAEAEYRQVITDDPGRVTRDIVYGQGRANFDADTIDSLLACHITEGWSDETDRILRDDKTVRVLSVDANSPLYTIETQADVTAKFDRLLRQLLTEKDPLFNRSALDEAIQRVEARKKAENPKFAGFTKQQHKAFDSFERRLAVWEGSAGSGKSILNEVHREMAEIMGREIRGFTTAEKAAAVLRESSGIQSVNQARALVEETRDGVAVMPENARFVFDEFSMASIESGVAILERALASNASGVLQGDLSQLGPISPGNTFGLATRAAADNKALVRLTEVFRQREGTEVAFMREAVPRGSTAIRTARSAAFAAYIEEFMDRGLVTHHKTREEEVNAIAADIIEATRAGEKVIAPGRSFQDCLYVNRAVRAGLGLEGTGHEFEFDRGVIELAVGDRVMFRANDRRLDVKNSDTGTVKDMAQDEKGRWKITVAVDNGKTVAFDPAVYRKIVWSFAATCHASQGSGAPIVIGSIRKSDDARSVHVTLTRTEAVLKIHTHMTRDEILKHLTSDRSLAAKHDALLFQAIVNKTGGENTPWAKAVKRAAANDADPLRLRHIEIMAQRRTQLQDAIRDILAQPDMKPRERNRQLAAAAEQFAPASFVSWCAAERAALEQEWQARQRVVEQRNERAETQKREAERAQTRARAIERPAEPEQKKNRGMRR